MATRSRLKYNAQPPQLSIDISLLVRRALLSAKAQRHERGITFT